MQPVNISKHIDANTPLFKYPVHAIAGQHKWRAQLGTVLLCPCVHFVADVGEYHFITAQDTHQVTHHVEIIVVAWGCTLWRVGAVYDETIQTQTRQIGQGLIGQTHGIG